MLLYGYLAFMQDHCVHKAKTYQLETGGCPSSDVYQSGSHHPFCVFPESLGIPFYNGHRHMAFMLHGHTHKTEESVVEEQIKEQLRAKGQRCEAYNVGAMWQGYEPQTLEEIVARQGRTILLV